MKKLLFALLMFPFMAMAQDDHKTKQSDFQGWKIVDCQKYGIAELAKGDNGVLVNVAKRRITPQTKNIYIAKQTWLKNLPDTANGMQVKYVDIDSNAKEIYTEVKEGTAVVFYMSPFELKSNMCEMWLFPIDITKKGRKYKQEYSTTAYKMNFFFNYDPPVYEYRGTDAVVLE